MIQSLIHKDFYKVDHRRQYPKGTSLIYSNFTSRESRIESVQSHIVFGVQYFIKEYLIKQWNESFFKVDKELAIKRYKRIIDASLGKDTVPMDHLEDLHDLGHLPLCIKSLPEGSLCPLRVPCITLYNTVPRFYWITNFIETILSNVLWGAMTSATIAYEYKKILNKWAKETEGILEFVQWQGHDFSMRGMMGLEAAVISGSAHLLSFTGTDTIPAIDFLERYYNADCEKELIGGSVPATEHSVMCTGGKETELQTYVRLLTEVYPSGIVSIVSDTWDFWRVLTETLPLLKSIIISRDGKLVIRPDSGNPVLIICGDPDAKVGSPEYKGALQILFETFGGHSTENGYRHLDKHIGLIYGDSITLDRCQEICKRLAEKGFSSTNVVFGIGSYTYQYVTRDTLGFAMKSTYSEINEIPQIIFKDPKTDNGIKKSAKGLLRVNEDFTLSENVSWAEERGGLLDIVFENGLLINETSLSEIRKRMELHK